MQHQIIKITKVRALKPYILEISFDNNVVKQIDITSILQGPVFGPLQDWYEFRKVKLNPEVHTIEWPNGADFDPETLYHWENYQPELARRAQKWGPKTSTS